MLRPGGLLLVRVPALKMLWGAHDEAVHSRHRYTRGEVRRLLEGAGLRGACALTYANTLLFPVLAAAPRPRPPDRPPRLRRGLPARARWSGPSAALLRAEARLVRRVLAARWAPACSPSARKPGRRERSGYNAAIGRGEASARRVADELRRDARARVRDGAPHERPRGLPAPAAVRTPGADAARSGAAPARRARRGPTTRT